VPAYNGRSKRIKNALKAVLAGITYDAGGGAEQAMYVLDSSSGQFEGYPGLRVLPADIDSDKASVAENERVVRFLVSVHLPMEDNAESEAATYDKMYDLTDLILDTLDVGDFTGALNAQDPTIGTYFLNATRGDWFAVEENAGVLLVCDLNVEIKYSKDLA
jgi:hypothetical protein